MYRRLIAGLILATFVTACSAHKPWGKCAVGGAIIGAAALGAAGGAIANNVDPPFTAQDSDRGAGIGIGIATGAILGALIGHAICDEEEVPPPPPPPPAPAPAAKKKIVLRGVNFDFDKATLQPQGKPILEEAAKILKENPSINVEVRGFTDSVGSKDYNLRLSDRRAATVKNFLVSQGVPASRLTTKGFGMADPVASNDTADGRAQNRRVELVPNS
ncbi:MAG: OmpA family protein [Deltaproteobacteria bacterium]|nr:OmpA family protein [Deltaproteobacteria bacterium]